MFTAVGAFNIVEMLFSTNLLAIVGAGEQVISRLLIIEHFPLSILNFSEYKLFLLLCFGFDINSHHYRLGDFVFSIF